MILMTIFILLLLFKLIDGFPISYQSNMSQFSHNITTNTEIMLYYYIILLVIFLCFIAITNHLKQKKYYNDKYYY